MKKWFKRSLLFALVISALIVIILLVIPTDIIVKEAESQNNSTIKIKLNQIACFRGNVEACKNIVVYYVYDRKDIQSALLYAHKACELDKGWGNRAVAILYSEKTVALEPDYFKSYEYAKKSCDAGDAVGCGFLGRLYLDGNGVKQDIKKGLALRDKSCSMKDDFSCYKIGEDYLHGYYFKKNTSQAKEFFGKACDLKSQEGCSEYAKLNVHGYV